MIESQYLPVEPEVWHKSGQAVTVFGKPGFITTLEKTKGQIKYIYVRRVGGKVANSYYPKDVKRRNI